MLKQTSKRAAVLAVLAGGLVRSGCDQMPELRVIHTSPDAPPVNVFVEDKSVATGLDYAESSGIVDVDKGRRDIVVQAIPPGDTLDVITVENFKFNRGRTYTVLAVDNTANIMALPVNDSEDEPKENQVAIAVVHASPLAAAASVDVYVTGPDDLIDDIDPNFNFGFKDSVDAGALPAGKYRIRVTAPGGKDPVYDSGEVDLSGLRGEKILLVAVNTVKSVTSDASPIKIMAYTDTATIELLDKDTLTAARVVHLSPDAPTVEVFASSSALMTSPTELITAFSYGDTVPTSGYVDVPAGDYVFDVAVDGDGIGLSAYTSPSLTLAPGAETTAIAAGYLGMDPFFGLLATGDENRSIVTQASVKVVHGAPLAGPVDVYVTPADANFSVADLVSGAAGDPLLKDFKFGDITDYVPVVPDDYDVRVVTGGAAPIDFEVTLTPGLVATVIAREPTMTTSGPTDFGVVVLTNQ